MKVLVLSDIHANWPALKAVHAQEPEFEACLVLGDLVDYGPNPVEVLDWVRQHATVVVRGNHDHAVAQFVMPRNLKYAHQQLRHQVRLNHWKVLNRDDLQYLARLPVRKHWNLGQKRYLLLHATPHDPLHEYQLDPEIWRQMLTQLDAEIVCVGHTHSPMHLAAGEVQLVNPGSVGQPRDGNPKARYAVIEGGQVHFRETEYDTAEVVEGYRQAGLEEMLIQTAELMLSQGLLSVDHLLNEIVDIQVDIRNVQSA